MEYRFKDLDSEQIRNIVGVNDANLRLLEDLYGCGIVFRDDYFKILSDDETIIDRFMHQMDTISRLAKQGIIDRDVIRQSFFDINEDDSFRSRIISYSNSGKPYRCKTRNQYEFCRSVMEKDLVICEGPAGTGKTFLAVLMAVDLLKKNRVNRIVITRPAVEAGESLGFLPGDLKEKIDPYLMPIYDALDEVLGTEQKNKLMERGTIEVMPLAYMRGRTLNESFIILDEAQNTTDKQMLMFLTRLGFNSKMLVNGDLSQIDLNISKVHCGLKAVIEKLEGLDEIGIVRFNNNDVVRNPLVQRIIERFILDR